MPLPRLFYSPDYDIHAFGLEKLHPFDTCKHSRAYEELKNEGGATVKEQTTLVAEAAGDDLLRLVHSQNYLEELKSPAYLARALEVGFLATLPYALIEARVLEPMRRAVMGTMLATRHVLENGGAAINFAGGYHHASSERGEGFCLFADIPIAINHARQSGLLKPEDSVLIVDLDAHQGNGFERVFLDDHRVKFLDAYNRAIYPQDALARSRIDYDVPLAPDTNDETYLAAIEAVLNRALRETQPSLVFYNAGTDIYEGDALGGLKVSGAGVLKRDAFIFGALREIGVPWVMVPSGGYSPQSYHLIANAVKLLCDVC
jgi:histone deacetylase 11